MVGPASIVIVGTQGHGDEEALETAMKADPAFIGLVASAKRGDAVRGYLSEKGVSAEKLSHVKAPVGIDLGHTTPGNGSFDSRGTSAKARRWRVFTGTEWPTKNIGTRRRAGLGVWHDDRGSSSKSAPGT